MPGSSPSQQHARVLLAGHDVGVGDDDARRRRPSPSPRRPGRRPCRAPSRRCARPRRPAGRRRSPPPAPARAPPAPSMRGNGSRFSSALSSPLVGGRTVFRRWSTYERWTCLAQLAARAERDRAQHPDDAEPDAGGQHRAERAVERAARGRAHARAQPVAEPLEAHRQHRARHERADQAERGRPAGVGAARRARAGRPACRSTRRSRSRPARARRTTKPWAHPNRASRITIPRMIQSSPVIVPE